MNDDPNLPQRLARRRAFPALTAYSLVLGAIIGQFSDAATAASGWDAVGLWGVCVLCLAAAGVGAWIYIKLP